MVIIDRVICNFCHDYIGQLFSTPAVSGDGLECLTVPPHFCVCPGCYDSSQVITVKALNPVRIEIK